MKSICETQLRMEIDFSKNYVCVALASVAQLVGHHPTNQKVTGLIPSQDTCLGYEFSPWLQQVQKATDQ